MKEAIDILKNYLNENDLELNLDLGDIEEEKIELDSLSKAKAYIIYFREVQKVFVDFDNEDWKEFIVYHRDVIYEVLNSKLDMYESGYIGATFELRRFLNARMSEINEMIDLCKGLKENSGGGFQ